MLLGVRITMTWGVALALMTACGSRSASSAGAKERAADTEIAIEVENHNYSDIVIYLVRGGQSQRLGMVTGLSTAHYVFPYRRLGSSGDARLRAHPIGGPAPFTSENLYVQPGQWIKWTLENDLSRSFLGVY
jgi:hypothetical protein